MDYICSFETAATLMVHRPLTVVAAAAAAEERLTDGLGSCARRVSVALCCRLLLPNIPLKTSTYSELSRSPLLVLPALVSCCCRCCCCSSASV